jgi:hypothetical protein
VTSLLNRKRKRKRKRERRRKRERKRERSKSGGELLGKGFDENGLGELFAEGEAGIADHADDVS